MTAALIQVCGPPRLLLPRESPSRRYVRDRTEGADFLEQGSLRLRWAGYTPPHY